MDMTSGEIREIVRHRYANQARRLTKSLPLAPEGQGCCGSACDPIASNLYAPGETAMLPEEALQASLGCGNPTALASLQPDETVLDLGSGGGIDVLLAARRVAPNGFVYGLDMTDEMLELARQNQARDGATNVEFRKGFIEEIPLSDESVDVIISNCVVNLSADKARVLREAFRVLRPGGRLAISDIVVRGALPDSVRGDMESWAGCVAGALDEQEYERLLQASGFEGIRIEATRAYSSDDVGTSTGCCGSAVGTVCGADADGDIISAFVQARKPAR